MRRQSSRRRLVGEFFPGDLTNFAARTFQLVGIHCSMNKMRFWITAALVLAGCGTSLSGLELMSDGNESPTGKVVADATAPSDRGVAPDVQDASIAACSPGSFSASATRCEPCPAGTFASAANMSSCTPWTSCPPGSYVSAEGTQASDRVCAACEPGSTTLAPNQPACSPETPAQTCKPGSAKAPSGECVPCAPGGFCQGADAAERACVIHAPQGPIAQAALHPRSIAPQARGTTMDRLLARALQKPPAQAANT